MSQSLSESNVLVVGGGSGIGLGIARAFAAAGARVAVSGRTESKLEDAIEGTSMKAHACDAVDPASVETLYAWFEKSFGSIDILAFCAGINIPNRTFADTTPEDFERVVRVNLTGAFNCLQAVLPDMRERGTGLIFNVTSIAGIQTIELAGVPYSVSKVAQTALGTFANLESLPDGVRLTNIYPGETNTPLLDDRPEPPPAEKRARMVHPEDIGDMAVAIARLPDRALVPEITITPTYMPRV